MLTTLVMTDIEDSTSMWDDVPDLMLDVLTDHDALIADCVRRHRGRVVQEKAEGDSTFSVFRRPADAVRAAAEIQRRLLAHPWPEGLEVRVRIGVHAGESTELHDRYYGQAVNRCARIRNAGHGGQILLSAPVVELLTSSLDPGVRLIDLGCFSMKGIRAPERIFQLSHPDLPQHFPALRVPTLPSQQEDHGFAPGGFDVPLPRPLQNAAPVVGRAAPLRALTDAWERAAAGGRAAVVVCGEPGVGKTTLAGAVARYADARGAAVLYGRCDEDLPVPYQPFTEALSALTAAAGAETVRTWLGARTADLARLLPELAGGQAPVPQSGHVDPDADRWTLFEAVCTTLAAAGEEQPVLLVLDDLQWAATPTLQMLRHLLRSPRRTRLLVVATYRDTDVGRAHPLTATLADLDRENALERLPLQGLDPEGVGAMLGAAAGHDLGQGQRELAAALHGQTAGNPFFVAEILRYLTQTGALAERDGRWTSDVVLEDVRLPTRVLEMVGRRLVHLSPEANRVLTTAAVVGAHFSVEVLEQVTGLDADVLLDALEEAVAAGLLVDERGRFGFAHAIVRYSVADDLTVARRVRLHARIAKALEAVAPHDADALAYHFAGAASQLGSAKAAEHALQAARRARERSSYEDARSVLERALEVLEQDPAADPERRCDVRLELAAVRRALLGRGAERELVLAAAEDARLTASAERLAWAALLAYPGGVGDPWPAVEALYDDALSLLGPDHTRLRSDVLGCLAEYRFDCLGQRDEALPVARQAVALARTTGSRRLLVARLACLVHLLRATHDSDERSEALRELAELTTEVPPAGTHEREDDSRFGWVRIGTARSGIGAVESGYLFPLDHGDLAGFERFLADRREVAERTCGWASRYDTLTASLSLAALRGQWEDALRLSEELLAHGPDDADAVNVWGAGRCIVLRDTGRHEEVLPLLEAAAGGGVAAFRAAWGVLLAEAGQRERAEQVLADLVGEQAPPLPVDQTYEVLIALLVELAVRLDRPEVTAALQHELSPLAGRIIGASAILVCLGAADRFRAMAATALGRLEEAEELFEAALELEERVGSTPMATRTRRWYAQLLLDRGDAALARPVVEEALAAARGYAMSGVAGELELLLGRLGSVRADAH